MYNYFENDYSITGSANKKVLISNIKTFVKHINYNLFNEQNKIIKEAYKTRIKNAKKYMDKLKNTSS